jgi:predicted transcriptional regulator
MGTNVLRMEFAGATSDTTVRAITHHVVALLKEADISRMEASRRTGIPRETFYRKASGQGKPFDVEELARIGSLVGLTVAEIVAGAAERAA